MSISRRGLLKRTGLGALLLLPPVRAFASEAAARKLAFEHLHTGESLSVTSERSLE